MAISRSLVRLTYLRLCKYLQDVVDNHIGSEAAVAVSSDLGTLGDLSIGTQGRNTAFNHIHSAGILLLAVKSQLKRLGGMATNFVSTQCRQLI